MKKHQLFQLAFGLLLSHTGMAQVKTHYWTTKDQVAVTIDQRTGYAYVDGSKSPLIPTGNITVKPGPEASIDLLIEIAGGDLSIVKTGRHGTYLLRPQSGQDVFDVANRIYESGQAQWAFPEFIIDVVPFQNDPLYASQYYLRNTGQNGGTVGMDIKAPQAWLITTGVNKVKVAVIDTGAEPHEDLEETTLSGTSSRVLPGYDPLDSTNPGLPTSSLWYRGHGESVAGIIGASHNALGVAGVSPCSDVTPVNIFGPAGNTSTSLAEAIDWAWDQGQADVLNNSWGYSGCSGYLSFPDIEQAILNARTLGRNGKGSPVVFASGNAGCNTVAYPANVPGVIAVGALDRNGNLTTYSNSGPETAVVAFGGYADIVTTDLMGPDGFSAGDYNYGFDGTSAACPQVAGALALMLSANPDLTEAQLTQLLHTTATDMGPSGFDNTFGYGRLNVEAAVRAALPLIAGPIGVSDQTASTYSVPQQPGTTVTWQAEPAGLFLNAQATGATASFTADLYPSDLGQQCGTMTATITGPCGSVTLSKAIVVYPGATDFRGQVPPCPATGGGGGDPTSRMAAPVSAYPNPANDRLTLPQGVGKAVLLNAYGKIVQYPDATGQFDVRSLPAGLYNLQIQQGGKLSNQHIEVQH